MKAFWCVRRIILGKRKLIAFNTKYIHKNVYTPSRRKMRREEKEENPINFLFSHLGIFIIHETLTNFWNYSVCLANNFGSFHHCLWHTNWKIIFPLFWKKNNNKKKNKTFVFHWFSIFFSFVLCAWKIIIKSKK